MEFNHWYFFSLFPSLLHTWSPLPLHPALLLGLAHCLALTLLPLPQVEEHSLHSAQSVHSGQGRGLHEEVSLLSPRQSRRVNGSGMAQSRTLEDK